MTNIYNNLDRIFDIVEIDFNQVIIEVKADTPLLVAKYPFVSSEMKYISVTRGKNHILTVINKDGTTWGFYWGDSGHTLIGNSEMMLRENVEKFISDNGILIDCTTNNVKEAAKIFYNNNYKKWQLTIGETHYFSSTAKNANEMIEECKKFVTADMWIDKTAQVGFEMKVAVNQKINYK